MIKLVRVILSAQVDQFVGGIQRALGSFSGLTSGIASGARSAISFLGDIGNIVSGVAHGFNMLAGAARGLWDTFVQGAIDEERLGMTMKYLSGSAETASAIMVRLDDWTVRTGVDSGEAEEAILDMAKALRATYGEVDPEKLFQSMDLLQRLHIITGKSVIELSGVVGRAITGDADMLARALGISKEQLAKLSPEFAKFMDSAQGAQGAQLNEVMRLEGQAEQASVDMLKMFEEITTGMGVGQEAVAEYASTTGGEVLTLQALWDNFTEDVGKEMLPTIQTALEKLITFITDHEEDIDKFVVAIGNLAEVSFDKLMEFIESGEGKEFLKNLGQFSATQWQAFAAAIGQVDWEKIANTVNAITNLVGFFAGTNPTEGGDIKLGLPGIAEGIGGTTTAKTQDQGIPSLLEMIFGKPTPPQEVNVTVSVDDDGKLNAVMEKITKQHMQDLVDNVTGDNKKKIGVQ